MIQKHHQEEISESINVIETVSLTKNYSRLKRTRIQNRKTQENQVQSQLFKVLFLRSTTRTVSTLNDEYSSSIGNDTSQSKRRRSPNRQNSS